MRFDMVALAGAAGATLRYASGAPAAAAHVVASVVLGVAAAAAGSRVAPR